MNINLLRQAVQLVPAVIPHLSQKARFYFAEAEAYKSYDFMLARVDGLVRGVYTGNVGGDFVDIMGSLIKGQMEDAYRQAWNDEGYEGALPDYLVNSLDAFVIREANFDWIYQFYKDIVDARVDKTPLEPLLSRAKLWANKWNAAYNEALRVITIENGGNLIWVLGEAEHCTTCLALNGIVASGKEWEASGWKPQSADLECHGYNCKCQLLPTSNRRSRDAAGQLAKI